MSKIMLCKHCHSASASKRKMPGSIAIELLLWCSLLLPGLIYSLWRHSATKPSCKLCGSIDLVPLNSPYALERGLK